MPTVTNKAQQQALIKLPQSTSNGSIAAEALIVASTQMDVCEVGNNAGPEVSTYLRSVGLGPGYAWCMAFVYWCVQVACMRLLKSNPLIKTAGVLDQFNRTTLRILPKTSTAVKPGDIGIMDFGKGQGHTFFVERVEGAIIHTIEGNTNDDGSREGKEVARRQRIRSSIKAFIQLP